MCAARTCKPLRLHLSEPFSFFVAVNVKCIGEAKKNRLISTQSSSRLNGAHTTEKSTRKRDMHICETVTIFNDLAIYFWINCKPFACCLYFYTPASVWFCFFPVLCSLVDFSFNLLLFFFHSFGRIDFSFGRSFSVRSCFCALVSAATASLTKLLCHFILIKINRPPHFILLF